MTQVPSDLLLTFSIQSILTSASRGQTRIVPPKKTMKKPCIRRLPFPSASVQSLLCLFRLLLNKSSHCVRRRLHSNFKEFISKKPVPTFHSAPNYVFISTPFVKALRTLPGESKNYRHGTQVFVNLSQI